MKRKLSRDEWVGIFVVGMTVISFVIMIVLRKISQ